VITAASDFKPLTDSVRCQQNGLGPLLVTLLVNRTMVPWKILNICAVLLALLPAEDSQHSLCKVIASCNATGDVAASALKDMVDLDLLDERIESFR